MNRYINGLIAFLLTIFTFQAHGQIVASGQTDQTTTNYPVHPENHPIFLFADIQSGSLSATPIAGTNVLYTWYSYSNGAWSQRISGENPELSIPLEETGYRVSITNNGNPAGDYYCWVFQPELISAEIEVVEHDCSTLSLNTSKEEKLLTYYDLTNNTGVVLNYNYSYSWQSIPSGDIAGKTDAMPSISAPYDDTNYSVSISAFNGASESDASTDIVAKAVQADFTMDLIDRGYDNEIQELETFKGSAPVEIKFNDEASKGHISSYTYSRTRVDEPNIYTYPKILWSGPTIKFEDVGNYNVQLTVENDSEKCTSSTDTIKTGNIEVYEMSVEVPNVFTPDGDKFNQNFKAIYHSVRDFKMVILNRWGRKVFSTTNPGDYWDGTIGGRKAAEGVYFYFIEAKGYKKGESMKLEGALHLIRGN